MLYTLYIFFKGKLWPAHYHPLFFVFLPFFGFFLGAVFGGLEGVLCSAVLCNLYGFDNVGRLASGPSAIDLHPQLCGYGEGVSILCCVGVLAGVYNPVGVMANVSRCVVGVADVFLKVGVDWPAGWPACGVADVCIDVSVDQPAVACDCLTVASGWIGTSSTSGLNTGIIPDSDCLFRRFL